MRSNSAKGILTPSAYRLKAGVLYYTLFVALVMLLVVGLFLLIFYQESFLTANIKRSERISSYFSSALTLALFNPASGNFTKNILLFEEDRESSVAIAQSEWGMYNILTLSLTELPKVAPKSYLIGITPHDTIRQTGLYLRNNFSYLSVSGSTVLTGRTYLPYSGIASSSIEGVGYTGDSLVYGKKLFSRDSLPAAFSSRLTRIVDWIKEPKGEDISLSEPVAAPFSKKTRVVDVPQLLSRCSLSGNIVIRSAGKLTLSRNAQLKNVIVYAPTVYVESGFRGSCQLFATDTVIIQKGVTLRYPSGIAILSKNEGYLQVDSTSRIYGYAIVRGNDNAKVGLRIRSSASIFGYAYCSSKVDHRGAIYGSLYAYGFEFRTGWGLYTSSLLNAKVLGNELSPSYVFPYVASGRKAVIAKLP